MQTGELSCWGAVEDSADTRSGHRFVDAASTLHTTCGLTAQGALHCFGRDLGMPPSGHRLTQITGGADHFCALTEAQHAFCWGRDTDGQLDAPADTRFQQLSAGHFHTCGITAEGLTTCWGRTTEGAEHTACDDNVHPAVCRLGTHLRADGVGRGRVLGVRESSPRSPDRRHRCLLPSTQHLPGHCRGRPLAVLWPHARRGGPVLGRDR